MNIPYWHVDAFAERPLGGNQAAVMLLEEWLPDETLIAIAAENNFAETAFLVRDETGAADWELRWCTPTCEIRLCGHATLASGHALLSHCEEFANAERVTFRTRQAGILEVARLGERYELALPAIPTEPGKWAEAVALLGAEPDEIHLNPAGYGIYLFESEADIHALRPDLRGLEALGDDQFICTAPGLDPSSAPGLGDGAGTDVVSRVFVPGGGVDEDSFTGSAHAVLTPFWAERLGRDSFTAFQASPRGGHATCRLAKHPDGDRAILSGRCATVVEGTFHLSGPAT